MKTFNSNFIGRFKIGDNINYNLQCLTTLENVSKGLNDDDKKYLIKFKIITIVSIMEAIMYDLMLKIRTYTNEGVPNIPTEKIQRIKSKKPSDKFGQLIDIFKKYELLGDDNKLYESLIELKKLRNRIHIQNMHNYEMKDELPTFTAAKLKLAQTTLQKVLTLMDNKYGSSRLMVEC